RGDHWIGTVKPIDQHMTFFLPVTARPDGTLSAFLENGERNVGRFFDIQRIAVEGNRVKLLGKDSKMIREGTFDADDERISLFIAPANGTYDFHRATAADEAAFYPRAKAAQPYVYRKPAQRDDGWPVGTLEEVGISREAI